MWRPRTPEPGESHQMDFPGVQDFFGGRRNCPAICRDIRRQIRTQFVNTITLACGKPPTCPIAGACSCPAGRDR